MKQKKKTNAYKKITHKIIIRIMQTIANKNKNNTRT